MAQLETRAAELVEIVDEREELAEKALAIIGDLFPPHDRQPLDQLVMEMAERRMQLHATEPYHILAAVDGDARPMAVAAGVYLGGANAGMVTYLGVRPEFRERRLGKRLRRALVDTFRTDARHLGHAQPNWVVGEVRLANPWLQRLVRDRAAIPFDFTYYHPGVGPGRSDERWVLYRQPIGDPRTELPAREARRLVYDLWRRAYRVRWPLEHPGFAAMMEELQGERMIGTHPGVVD